MLKSLELNPLNINRFAFETSEKGDGSFNKVRYYIEGDVVNPEMELALKGQKTVEKALKDAAEKINRKVLSLVNE